MGHAVSADQTRSSFLQLLELEVWVWTKVEDLQLDQTALFEETWHFLLRQYVATDFPVEMSLAQWSR